MSSLRDHAAADAPQLYDVENALHELAQARRKHRGDPATAEAVKLVNIQGFAGEQIVRDARALDEADRAEMGRQP